MILTKKHQEFLEKAGFIVNGAMELPAGNGETFITQRIEKGHLTLNLYDNCKAELNKKGRMLTIQGEGRWTCHIHNTGSHYFDLH